MADLEDLDFSSEESISKILESICEHASPSYEYRVKLLQDLKHAVNVQEAPRPLWKLTDWAIVTAVIILAIIAYGIWLPQHVVTNLLS